MDELTVEQRRELDKRFTYHPPKEGQLERYQRIREQAKSLAEVLMKACPQSRELSVALTHLETACFFANAAIARNE